MTHTATFATKWPGASLWQALRALDRVPPRNRKRMQRALSAASRLAAQAAATRLLRELPTAWRVLPADEKKHAIAGIGELIRVGADPSAALSVLAIAAGTHRMEEAAGRALRDAVERGFDLTPILPTLRATWAAGDTFTRGRLEPVLRLQRVAERHGAAVVARVARHSGAVGRLLEEALAGDGPHAAALSQLDAPTPSPAFVRAALARSSLRGFAIQTLEVIARREGAAARAQLQDALPAVAAALEMPEDAGVAARCISAALAIGCDPAPIRSAIDAARAGEAREVRVDLSRALSKRLVEAGQEAPLPSGQSHRRTYAVDDTPIDPTPRPCARCGGATLLIYAHHEGGNTWAEDLAERRCTACGVYFISVAGY